MLEELIEKYLEAKRIHDGLYDGSIVGKPMDFVDAGNAVKDTARELAEFIGQHAATFISWERQYALRLSPFED